MVPNQLDTRTLFVSMCRPLGARPTAASGLPPTPCNTSLFWLSPSRRSPLVAVLGCGCACLFWAWTRRLFAHSTCSRPPPWAAGPGPAAVYSPYSWLAASHVTAPSAVLAWFDAHSALNHGVVRGWPSVPRLLGCPSFPCILLSV